MGRTVISSTTARMSPLQDGITREAVGRSPVHLILKIQYGRVSRARPSVRRLSLVRRRLIRFPAAAVPDPGPRSGTSRWLLRIDQSRSMPRRDDRVFPPDDVARRRPLHSLTPLTLRSRETPHLPPGKSSVRSFDDSS